MYDYERYSIEVGQVYKDGAGQTVQVIDVQTHKDCGDVIVRGPEKDWRIDAFKLAMMRYTLVV